MEGIRGITERLRAVSASERFTILSREEGRVISVSDDVATVSGLISAGMYELLEFEGGSTGIAYSLDRDSIGVILLRKASDIKTGDRAYATGKAASVGAGDELLGRVIDPLGQPLDNRPAPSRLTACEVEREAPPLAARDYVSRPLYTGIRAIDAMLPIGRGQRELIIGDLSTGKTSLAVTAISRQKEEEVISIYVSIGQKKSQTARTVDEIARYGDPSRTIIVAADASEPLGLQFIAPYSATAIAEYFMDRGRDLLIIYDDLTKHAKAYRSLSLLLRRPPAREAYPGDIFFVHSRLLERSAQLSRRFGGGSITSLPIVETQQGRIASYIPTNLISITDGQIYLDTGLFNKGIRPAIDIGRSVSRIGGKAQTEVMKKVSERLKIDYSRFLDVEVFTKFGSRVEEETARLIRHGERLREILKQPRLRTCPVEDEVIGLLALESGALDSAEISQVRELCDTLTERVRKSMPSLVTRITAAGRLSPGEMTMIKEFCTKNAGITGDRG